MGTTETQRDTVTKLERIAWLSAKDPTKEFGCIMHHVNVESLQECYELLGGKKAVGIDGVTKEEYGEVLLDNLEALIGRMKRMGYRPAPVRQVSIPKAGQPGAHRVLGISNFEDKLVQKQFQRILESIYDPIFLPCSYGFRPGRSCHDAIGALHQYLYKEQVAIVIDVDLEKFFDTIDHKVLEEILRIKIKDERFIRYIIRMFKAGILAEGELTLSEEGVAQGSCVSPMLSNILAHYVIDSWFEETVKVHCRGKAELFRYCDDLVICCQYATDAQRIKDALSKRLNKFKLRMNEEKTKMVRFDRKENQATSFSFLGFTFYWGYSQKGRKIPKVKTEGKRLRAKLKKVNEWARSVRHKGDTRTIWKSLCKKLQGHIQYYGVSFNTKRVGIFLYHAKCIMFYWFNRRSQKKSFTWGKFARFEQRHPLPTIKVYHRLF